MNAADKSRNISLLRNQLRIILISVLLLTTSCASGPVSFDRHNLSRLWIPDGGEEIFFDATITPDYPRDSDTAEAARLSWIEEWLELRNLCAEGFDVTGRRDFTRDDDNPYMHDLRYTLRCR